MKKLGLTFGMILSLILVSCEGPSGPPGPPGPPGFDGEDGINILGQVYDIQGDFTPGNGYSIFSEFAIDAPSVEVFETDVVLVYILWEQTEDGDGLPVDIWRLLPQTRILNQGLLQYNYDHTFFDVSVFLESDFDLSTLQPGDTDNQVFRIAIVPAEFGQTSRMDVSNIESVMSALRVEEKNINRIVLD